MNRPGVGADPGDETFLGELSAAYSDVVPPWDRVGGDGDQPFREPVLTFGVICLMILGLGVHLPAVVMMAAQDIPCR